jgi:hypothetical protein
MRIVSGDLDGPGRADYPGEGRKVGHGGRALRKSKMFTTFHWPKEFLEPMKKLKKELKNGGVDDSTHYTRIRPELKDGKWRIRADTKPKSGEGKFTLKATWPIMARSTTMKYCICNFGQKYHTQPANFQRFIVILEVRLSLHRSQLF